MLAAGAMRVTRQVRGGPARFRTHFPTSLGTYTHRKPYRKGVVCLTIASLILICGSIMTIFGATHVFGGSVTIVGMLMMAVAVLLFLFSIRQFLLAKKMRLTEQNLQITHGTVTAMVIEREDELGTVTVVMDTVNIEPRCREHHSEQDFAPPDYNEATSDLYPDSSGGEGADTSAGPPPPYGPPPYDDVVSEKLKSGERTEEEPFEDVDTNLNIEEENQTDNISHTSHGNQHLENTENGSTEQTPQNLMVGYQDLPTVTI